MVPDTPEHRYDSNITIEDEITLIPESPQTEMNSHISTDIFYKSCSTARKSHFDNNEINHLGKTYTFQYNIIY